MIAPVVAQLIAEERIAAGIRASETARLVALARGGRPSPWTRLIRGLVGGRLALRGLHRRRIASCATC